MKRFSKLNWRLILLHLTATWLLIIAVMQLSNLINIRYLNAINMMSQIDENTINEYLDKNRLRISELLEYQFYTTHSWILGLLISFLISLNICIRRKWLWLNSFIVFFITFIICYFNIPGFSNLKNILFRPGSLINNSNFSVIAIGIFMLLFGLLIFYNKGIQKILFSKN